MMGRECALVKCGFAKGAISGNLAIARQAVLTQFSESVLKSDAKTKFRTMLAAWPWMPTARACCPATLFVADSWTLTDQKGPFR